MDSSKVLWRAMYINKQPFTIIFTPVVKIECPFNMHLTCKLYPERSSVHHARSTGNAPTTPQTCHPTWLLSDFRLCHGPMNRELFPGPYVLWAMVDPRCRAAQHSLYSTTEWSRYGFPYSGADPSGVFFNCISWLRNFSVNHFFLTLNLNFYFPLLLPRRTVQFAQNIQQGDFRFFCINT